MKLKLTRWLVVADLLGQELTKLRQQKSCLMRDLLTGKAQVNIVHPETAHG